MREIKLAEGISVLEIVPLTITVLFRGYSNVSARSSAEQTTNDVETRFGSEGRETAQ